MNYCSHCGNKISFGAVPDEEKSRYYCEKCGTIHYQNPKIIVGSIPQWENKVLLCKRSIKPRYGLWTLPAGFLEMGEKVEDGAIRETREEAHANIEIVRLFSIYNLPNVGQVYLMFLADLVDPDFQAGTESLEVRLFKENEIPWDKMAFSAIKFTLEKYFADRNNANGEVHIGTLKRSWD